MDIPGMDDGLEVGLDNSWSTGFSLSLPIIAPALWKSLKLSAVQLEQSLESARSSRLSMVDQVKKPITPYLWLMILMKFCSRVMITPG